MPRNPEVAPLHERVFQHTDNELWGQVRLLRAEWALCEPTIKLVDVVRMLLVFSLKQKDRVWDEEHWCGERAE